MYKNLPEESIIESKLLNILVQLDSGYIEKNNERDKQRTRMILMDDYLLAAYTYGAAARGGMLNNTKVNIKMTGENSFDLWPLDVIQKMITYSLITELRSLRFKSEEHNELNFLINLIEQGKNKCFPIWAGGLVRARDLKLEDLIKDWSELFGLSISDMDEAVDKVSMWTKAKWTIIYVNDCE